MSERCTSLYEVKSETWGETRYVQCVVGSVTVRDKDHSRHNGVHYSTTYSGAYEWTDETESGKIVRVDTPAETRDTDRSTPQEG